jgi:hypothetical protein
MLQQRQVNDIEQLIEISFGTVTVGSITQVTALSVTVPFVIGSPSSSSPATFQIGDQLEIVVPAAASPVAGLIISAQPTSTPGTAIVSFWNASSGAIAPTSAVYRIIAKRLTPTVI